MKTNLVKILAGPLILASLSLRASDYPRVWQQAFPSASPPQTANGILMNYDEARQQVVLFGGADRLSPHPSTNHGTWTWNGQQWFLASETGPRGREWSQMVYDSHRQVCVMYGGTGGEFVREPLRETWEWNGNTWQLRDTNGPLGCVYHAMAYDRARQRTVLYGGAACWSSGCGAVPTWTWEWDGQSWTRVSTNGPPRRLSHAMAYDEARGRVVLFGGVDNGLMRGYSDTWTWDGTNWMEMPVAGPGYRTEHSMTYDFERQTVVLFGGRSTNNSVWEWDGAGWSEHPASVPRWCMLPGLAYDGARNAIVRYGGLTANDNGISIYVPETWLLAVQETWVNFAYAGLPAFPETGDFSTPFNTMQEAVDAARGGGSIVKGLTGNHRESLTINKGLRIEAVGGPVTIGR